MTRVSTIETPLNLHCEIVGLWGQTRAAVSGKAAIMAMQGVLQSPLYRVTPAYKDSNGVICNGNGDDVTERKQAYWNRARYFNATGRTHETLDGMIWSKPPEVKIPEGLEYINDKGIGLTAIAQQTTRNVISIGRHGGLVDMPNTDNNATRAEQSRGEKAPCIITYTAEQIVYWREDTDLLEVRLLEFYDDEVNEFTVVKRPQIRRLVLIDGIYHNQVYRKGELISSHTPVMDGDNMKFIPFQFFGADDNSSNLGPIPLFDLGSQNLGHYALDADNRDNLHYHGQGMTMIYTSMNKEDFDLANPNGLDVGAKGSNQLQQGDKVEILQIDATGAIASEMLRDEQRMVMLGAQLVVDTNSNQTLGAKEIDANATTSTLKRISMNCSQGITQLLKWCAGFLGISDDISYRLNTEFLTDFLDAQMVAQHFAAVQAGLLPQTSYFETARKAGLTNKTNEELVTEIGEQALGITGTTEEVAILMAEIDALKEQLDNQGA